MRILFFTAIGLLFFFIEFMSALGTGDVKRMAIALGVAIAAIVLILYKRKAGYSR